MMSKKNWERKGPPTLVLVFLMQELQNLITFTSEMKTYQGQIKSRYMEDVFNIEGCKTLEQIAQGNSGCPIPGSVPEWLGWGAERFGLVEGVPEKFCRKGK